MTEVIELQERSRGTRCCVPAEPALSTEEAERITSDLQIMAHPVRLQILAILARQDAQVCVCDIDAAVPVKQPTVSHHLKLLREAGLIDCERHGLWAYYFVNRDALAALRARIEQQLAVLA